MNVFRGLHEISANPGLSSSEQIAEYLRYGAEWLGAEIGICSRVAEDQYEIIQSFCRNGQVQNGQVFPLGQTFCSITLASDAPVAIAHVGISRHRTHPCYEAFQLESYIGIRLLVEQTQFGTLNFSGAVPREGGFSKEEVDFVQLLGQLIGTVIERQRRRDALLENRQQMMLALRASSTGVWEYNFDGDVLRWDAATRQIHGLPEESVSCNSADFFDIIHQDDREAVLDAVRRSPDTRSYDVEYRIVRRSDGAIRWISSKGEIVDRRDGLLLIGTLRDITRLKTAETALKQAYARQDELERLRNDLVQMVAHDMRSPLTVIAGVLELIQFQSPNALGAENAITVGHAQRACTSLVTMINDMVESTYLERADLDLNLTAVELGELTTRIVSTQPTASKPDRMVVYADGEQFVRADAYLLERVVTNLVNNAVEHTPPDASITVRTRDEHDEYVLTVQDTGPGIPEGDRARIFEKYGQSKGRSGGRRKVGGLGLSFCRLAIQSMGGSIGVESQAGKGSEFWIRLPKDVRPGSVVPAGEGTQTHHPSLSA